MSDHMLLTQAAKAANLPLDWVAREPDAGGPLWNPLLDNDAAFRLMVAMGMRVAGGNLAEGDDQVEAFDYEESRVCIEQACDHQGDMEAATRRAIVRMAALLGETHQGESHE